MICRNEDRSVVCHMDDAKLSIFKTIKHFTRKCDVYWKLTRTTHIDSFLRYHLIACFVILCHRIRQFDPAWASQGDVATIHI